MVSVAEGGCATAVVVEAMKGSAAGAVSRATRRRVFFCCVIARGAGSYSVLSESNANEMQTASSYRSYTSTSPMESPTHMMIFRISPTRAKSEKR